ncbi:hypothetical protein EG327_005767 [Venturia inaequalis]|uniref:Xylanolytic transcriptional activator regulatory domain-containing protein n=1 Tax=Venturia inaequalis TaxID=5025 RepID=A0A8H3V9B8_VENIN|nr:hypothetical protein EG327_005767 [Venturia inaequalis]
MERPNRQSRASATEEPNPNVFDDEYAVDIPDIELDFRVADGFVESASEAQSSTSTRRPSHTQASTVRRSIQSGKEAGERSEATRTRRSSIAKETRSSLDIAPAGGFCFNHHGLPSTSVSPSEDDPSMPSRRRNRPVSNASSFATVDDSLEPIAPSHPYDLFPQAANSFPADESEAEIVPAIPVGFPGRTGNFGRQIGPDGEDQGIVGPDGHTEDLPPYSKYPDATTVKPVFAAAAPISPVSPVDGPSTVSRAIPRAQDELVSPIVPADNPPSVPQSPILPSAPRAVPSQLSSRDLQSKSPRSSGYSIKDEKAWRDKTWRERRRTRVCGGRLPIWALLVAISIILFIAILVGGVIGGLLAVGKSREEPPTVTVTSTQSMFDASFIPAPTNLPQLPAGQYAFPLGIPQEQQKACLSSGDQYSAWSCNVSPMSLWGDVAAPPSGYNIMKLYPAPPPLFDGNPPRFNFTYGAQPPRVVPMQRVFWVQDLAEPGRGPALHFQTTYDKLVILEESQFGQGTRKRNVPQYGSGSPTDYTPLGERRPGESSSSPPHGGGFHRKSMLQTGDSPWYCYWNQTFIEGFIYVSQNSSANGGRSDGGVAAATTTVSGSTPTFSFSASSSAPTVTPTAVVSHQARAVLAEELEAQIKRMATPLPTPSKDYTVPKNPGPPQKFPFVFKLTERRTPGSGQQAGMAPYCQKMFVPAEGAPYPVHDDDGRPTIVHLNENDPSPQDYSTALRKPEKTGATASSSTPSSAHERRLNSLNKREDPPKSCHCLWLPTTRSAVPAASRARDIDLDAAPAMPAPRKKRKISADGLETEGRPRDLGRHLPLPLEPTDGPGAHEEKERRASIRKHQPIDDYANLKGPSLLKKTLGLQNHRHSKFVGSTSPFEQSLLAQATFNDKDEIPLGPSVLRQVNESTSFVLLPDQTDQGGQDRRGELADLDAIETVVAPHGQALINLYFRIVHPSFPVLHKKVYLEKYQRTHREFSPPLLAAVYIIALNWWSYSSELALLPKPDVVQLEKLAIKTMSYIVHRPKLSTIQAGLLLLQRPEGDSWALTSELVGLGQDLGLHLDCSRWRIPSWERGLRKRLAWGLYMQDKWGSLVHGRPSHITHNDWCVKPVTESDFPERASDEDDEDGSTEVEKGRILFCEMIRLTEILTLILSEFYTLKSVEESFFHAQEGGRWVLEKAKPIQIRLRDWFSQLPECLKMGNVKMRKLNSAGYLHLAYYAAEITLHRQILRSLAHETDQNLILICRSAALVRLSTVTDFVRGLRPEHLQSFWYSASKYSFAVVGTFIGLLWVTASTRDEADSYKEKLEEYRWTLRLSSKSAEFLDRAISMLTISTASLVNAIPGKRLKGDESLSPPMDAEQTPKYDIEQENDSAPEDEEWNAEADHAFINEISLQASPTQFSEEAMEMLWPGFSTAAAGMQTSNHGVAAQMPRTEPQQHGGLVDMPQSQAQFQQHDGFSLQPFMNIGGDFEVQTYVAYQPHYGGNPGLNGEP